LLILFGAPKSINLPAGRRERSEQNNVLLLALNVFSSKISASRKLRVPSPASSGKAGATIFIRPALDLFYLKQTIENFRSAFA
jgi:hypothetical protein